MKIRDDNRPLYQQAETALVCLLQGYVCGEQLPSEPALAQSLGISRATLREALRNLAEKQIISRRQGLGTFYNGPQEAAEPGFEVPTGREMLTLRDGLQASVTDLEIVEGVAGRYARELCLEPAEPVTIVSRTQVAGGRPVAYLVDVVPQAVATLEEVRQGFGGSVLDWLATRQEPEPSYTVSDVVPLKATKALAQRLQVARATVLLLLEETIYARDDVPIAYSCSHFVPRFFQFHLLRRIPRSCGPTSRGFGCA